MYQWQRLWLFSAVALGLMPAFVQASRIDDLVAALAGDDDQARTLARQLLPREGVSGTQAAAALEAGEQGRERGGFPGAGRPRQRGFRAWPRGRPHRGDGSPHDARADRATCRDQDSRIAALADRDSARRRRWPSRGSPERKDLRERAREALEETGTAASRTALRHHLAQAEPDPEFAFALLNSLGRLHDRESLELIARLAQDGNPKVRAAAARAWRGRATRRTSRAFDRSWPPRTRPRGPTRWTRISGCSTAWSVSNRTSTRPW